MRHALLATSLSVAVFFPSLGTCAEPSTVVNLWPDMAPGEQLEVGPEQDFTKPDDRLIAGRRIIKLGNVKTPQAQVFLPAEENRNETAVVICPGGGFNILAWDLEGTEVAEWLNSHGVTAIVLKYRVPTRRLEPRWLPPVQDAQRTISLVRQQAGAWGISPDKIGILGFSAGGETGARAALATERAYEAVDEVDEFSFRPNFAVIIYPGPMIDGETKSLLDNVTVTKDAPPMFLAHAFDDRVPPETSVQLFLALKRVDVPSELHIYDAGGHGYGLREVRGVPVTTWHHRCAEWMRRRGLVER